MLVLDLASVVGLVPGLVLGLILASVLEQGRGLVLVLGLILASVLEKGLRLVLVLAKEQAMDPEMVLVRWCRRRRHSWTW